MAALDEFAVGRGAMRICDACYESRAVATEEIRSGSWRVYS
jgi:hypothetical protein